MFYYNLIVRTRKTRIITEYMKMILKNHIG